MPRQYPRFLYSNPKNSKSKGPFCVHLLFPHLICKVLPGNKIELLECFDVASEKAIETTLDFMKDFLIAREKSAS